MTEPLKHYPALDGFRALCVLAVMLFHYTVIACGWTGVQGFFVLSGFLITGILAADKDLPLGKYLYSFYLKRALRIWPLYYAFVILNLLALAALGNPCVRQQSPWLLGYAANFFQMRHVGEPWLMGHFWSLAVEEQFYLLWPFVVFFFPVRRLAWIFGAIFLLGPALRGAFFLLPGLAEPHAVMYRATTSYFDAFAIGGLVALPDAGLRARLAARAKALLVCAAALLLCWMVFGMLRQRPADYFSFTALGLGGEDAPADMAKYFCLNLFFAAAINYLVSRKAPAWLENKNLVCIGLISYGMYVFHPLARDATRALPWPHSFTLRMPFYFAFTLALSAASYHFFEKPILVFKEKLKRRWRAGA
jgi:peptidoglycan/LPS O-acetylase OafA/YrhL